MTKTKAILTAAALLAFVVLLGSFNATKPRILVLQSGRQDSPWVGEVDRGMREVLKQNRRPVSVEWDYMGLGGPTSVANTDTARAEAVRAIDRINPDVLIAVDDEANLLVARDYVGRSTPRVVYVSLDRRPDDYGYVGARNVSGIAERLPFQAIKEALTVVAPGRVPGVALLGVDTVTGRAEMAQAEAFDWGASKITGAQLVSTAEDWRGFVNGVSASDVLVILSSEDLPERDGTPFTAADASRWTQQNSKALPIGSQVDFVLNGGALGFSPDPDEYGEAAIRLALDWLDARSTPGAPAPVESSHFAVSVRRDALLGRGIVLPPIYIEAARENGTLFD